MKKISFCFVILSLFLASSCSKNSNNPSSNNISNLPTNTWTFKSNTYTANTVSGNSSTGLLSASALSPQGKLSFNFYAVLPTSNGYYTVARAGNPQSADQVGLYLYEGYSNLYYSTGGDGNQKVYVSVNAGKVSVSGANLQFYSATNSADSSAASFNITQTQ